MASSRLLQFRAKAVEASKLFTNKGIETSKIITNKGSAYYKQILEKNKQYVQDPPTSETCNKLSDQLFYTRLASIPHRYDKFQNELKETKELLKNWRGLNVEQYGLFTLLGLECYGWFCLGKIIGSW